jgi:hypothetical protein
MFIAHHSPLVQIKGIIILLYLTHDSMPKYILVANNHDTEYNNMVNIFIDRGSYGETFIYVSKPVRPKG